MPSRIFWARMGAEQMGCTQQAPGGPRGSILLAADMDHAIAFVNNYTPEHLEHASEILLGENSVLTLGNYLIGPNCVLPTGGHARTWSPLSVHDFMKPTSIAQVTRAGHQTLAPTPTPLRPTRASRRMPMRCRAGLRDTAT